MTTYLESAAGIKAGGRTGLTAVVIALLFASCLFLEPLFSSIPVFATAPALIYVAANFMTSLSSVQWDDMAEALAVMAIAIIMPLTFSIAAGIAFGFIIYGFMKLVAGKRHELSSGFGVIVLLAFGWLALSAAG